MSLLAWLLMLGYLSLPAGFLDDLPFSPYRTTPGDDMSRPTLASHGETASPPGPGETQTPPGETNSPPGETNGPPGS